MAFAPRLLLLGCAVLVVAGCGNARTSVPSAARPSAPDGFRTLTLSSAGVRLAVPRNWTVVGQHAPLVVTVVSGAAVMALWRFHRGGIPPQGRGGLERTRAALLAAAHGRDRTLRLSRTSFERVDGAPAIVLEALERVNGQARRVSSVHVYARHAELVLDQYAPPAQFRAVDRAVFSPQRRSLTLLRSANA